MSDTNAQQTTPDNQVDQKLVGIRGWLIIFSIGFVVGPTVSIFVVLDLLWSFGKMMSSDYGNYTLQVIVVGIAILLYIFVVALRFFKKRQKALQTNIHLIAVQLVAPILLFFIFRFVVLVRLTSLGKMMSSDYGNYTFQVIVIYIAILFYTFVAALRFFKKSQDAPQTCIRLIVVNLVAGILFLILRAVFIGGVDIIAMIINFVAQGIVAAIWILYFRLSKRVKATFVNQEDSFGLPYKIVLPIRYLIRRQISWLAFAAVALCVFTVVVVMTVLTGLVTDFKQKNHSFVGDCVVGTESLVGFAYYEDFMKILERSDFVEGISPVIKSYALVNPVETERNVGVEIMGIDPVKHSRVTGFGQTLYYRKDDVSKAFKPAYDPDLLGCVIGIDLVLVRDARSSYPYEASPSETAFSVSCFPLTAKGALSKVGAGMVNTQTFYYSDNSESGLARVDSSMVYLPFEQAQLLCGMAWPVKRTNAIHIKFKPNVGLEAGCEEVDSLWQSFGREKAGEKQAYLLKNVTVQSWKDYRRAFIAAMEKEQTMMTALFALVGITTVFIVFVVFYMITSRKSKDMGILKSIGVSNTNIIQLFLGFAFLVGLLGSCIGLYGGWLFLLKINQIEDWLFERFGFQLWDRTIYAIGAIPNRVDAKVLAVIVLSAIAACLAGALVPSLQAAKQKPVETLQVSQL